MAHVIKSVSLNEKNEKDKKIIKHIARRNFSGYVKKLILEDIEKKEVEKESKKIPQQKTPPKKVMGKGITIQTDIVKPYFPKQN